MVTNVKDKTVLVTGGANGIGFSCVQELLRHGAKSVAILDLPNSNGENAVAKLENEFGKGRAVFFVCDITNTEQLETTFKRVCETFKGLDILINNAGIMDDSRRDLMIALNYTALVCASTLATEFMGKHNGGKGGTIVNVASIVGLAPGGICPIYSGTKHAVVGFSLSISKAYDTTGVRIMVMCPGVTNTTLITNKSDRFLNMIGHEAGRQHLSTFYKQPTQHVARSMIDLLEKGKNGTICVAEDSEPPYAVEIPLFRTLKKPL